MSYILVLIGQGERTVAVRSVARPHCAETTSLEPWLRYKFAELDLQFGMVHVKRYQLACPGSGHGWRLETRETEARCGVPPIQLPQCHVLGIAIMLAAASLGAVWRFSSH